MKNVVSISLGSSLRNKSSDRDFAGIPFHLERIGTDGDVVRAARLIAEYDGKVEAIGLGGMDRYLVAGNRRYEIRQAGWLARQAKVTPVVDGGGIKRVLEPLMIRRLAEEGVLEVAGKRVLIMAGVDRPGMAEIFPALGAKVVYGDLLFAVGVPVPLHSLGQVKLLAALCLPALRLLPMSVLYPTGSRQDSTKPKHGRHFQEAEIIAGDFVFIKRYMPDDLQGKVIVTNTTRTDDLAALRKRGVRLLITTTPPIGGESFGTNLLEGVLVALSGKRPEELTEQDYLDFAEAVGWQPGITRFD